MSDTAEKMKLAVEAGNIGAVRRLLDQGFSIEGIVFEPTKDTPLARAADWGHTDIINLLLDRGADVNRKGDEGHTPLHRTVRDQGEDFPEAVKLLIRRGADIEAKDNEENTPLILAASHGLVESVKILIENGAQVNAVNKRKRYAIDAAISYAFNYKENEDKVAKIVEMLLDAGADIHHNNDEALRQAALHGKKKIIEILLERGADIHAIDSIGRSIIHEAIRGNEPDALCPVEGAVYMLAREFRDWLVEPFPHDDDDKGGVYRAGGAKLDQYPKLVKKVNAAVGTEDFKYLTEVIEKAFYILDGVKLPHTPENVCNLITPRDNEGFKELADRVRCYDYSKCHDAKDMFEDIAQTLFLPSAALLSKQPPSQFGKSLYKNQDNVSLQTALQRLAIVTLIKGKNIEDILGLSEAWHSPRYDMPASLKPLSATGEWHALASEVTLSTGYKVTCCTNAKRLQDESRFLGHCVGKSSSYAEACLKGETHIFSITNGDGIPISTVEVLLKDGYAEGKNDIQVHGESKHLHVVQHRGKRNEAASPEAQKAFKEWKRLIERGKLKINLSQLGETQASKLTSRSNRHSELEQKVGFEITPENLEKVFLHYRGTEKNKGFRGVTFDPTSNTFDDDRHNHLVIGQYHETDGGGKKTGRSVKRENLTLDQWLIATGAKEEIGHLINNYIGEGTGQTPRRGRQV